MSFIQKTFGGLTTAYYIRQFLFGLIFYAIVVIPMFSMGKPNFLMEILWCTVLQFLYPYARFVYESAVNYIMGNNVFFVNAIIVLVVKFVTMAACWCFSWAIAPIGLAWLYWYHTKQEKMADNNE